MMKYLVGILLSAILVACGGGGGNPGTTSSEGMTGSTTSGSITLTLKRSDGSVIAGGRLSQTEDSFLSALVLDSAKKPVGGARVEFSLDSSEAKIVSGNGVALTDQSTGVATVRVVPSSVSSQGVVTAKAQTTIKGTALSSELYLDVTPGTVQLSNMRLSATSLQKGQSLVATVDVLVNGTKAPSNSVGVNFSSNCGTLAPASALVDSSGVATSVLQTTEVGSCQITASYNAVSLQQSFVVAAAPITSIRFVSATPEKIYQTGSPGPTQAIVKFKVVDSSGNAVSGVPVTGALTNTDGGINFCGSPNVSLLSNTSGEVQFSVCSGTLPATVQVKATLDSNTSVFALSNLLTVQTGLPTQRFFDVSASVLNFYAGGQFTSRFNGNETEISVYAADRQGNPVPAGTQVVFVSEGGQLVTSGASSCVIGVNGRCSVKLVGQEYRPLGSSVVGADPRPGRVTVLAYTDGEESFIDANNNNRYDAGELFEDLGLPFIDKDEDGILTARYTNLVSGTNESESSLPLASGAFGNVACPENVAMGLSAANTCNNVWDRTTKVRRSIVVVFSGGEIGQPALYHPTIPADKRTAILVSNRGGALVRLADQNGNPLPANTGLTVEVLNEAPDCSARLVGNVVPNSTEPTEHEVVLSKCGGGESVLLKATVQGKETSLLITVP